MFVIDVSMQCARATRHEHPAPLPLPGPKARLGHTTPEGFVCSRGRRTRRFRVGHCQGTGEVISLLQNSLNKSKAPSYDPRRVRLVPPAQKPQGPRCALSRYKRGHQTSAEIPEPSSLDLCRTLSPREAARPLLELTNGIGVPRVAVTTDHAVEPRGFEPRTSAVQGRRSPG